VIPTETITEDTIIVDTTSRHSSTATADEFDDIRHRLPSNEEDDPDASDVDQADDEPLTESTLFWSRQLVISKQDDNEIGLGNPSRVYQETKAPTLLRKISFI
jgi:hypothetical protein